MLKGVIIYKYLFDTCLLNQRRLYTSVVLIFFLPYFDKLKDFKSVLQNLADSKIYYSARGHDILEILKSYYHIINSSPRKKWQYEFLKKEGIHKFFETLVNKSVELNIITPIDFLQNYKYIILDYKIFVKSRIPFWFNYFFLNLIIFYWITTS